MRGPKVSLFLSCLSTHTHSLLWFVSLVLLLSLSPTTYLHDRRPTLHTHTPDNARGTGPGALPYRPNPDYGSFMRSNHMTRVLCGEIINASFPFGADFQNERTGAHELEPVTREHLECAKRNLLTFALVVVLEDLKEFPSLQARHLNCSNTADNSSESFSHTP